MRIGLVPALLIALLTVAPGIALWRRLSRRLALPVVIFDGLAAAGIVAFALMQRSVTEWHTYVVVMRAALVVALGLTAECGLLWLAVAQGRRAKTVAALVTALIMSLMAYSAAVGRYRYTVRRVDIASERIPPGADGLRIVAFSDTHLACFDGRPDLLAPALDSIAALRPDLLIFLGDMVNCFAAETDGWVDAFAALPARLGKYAVEGNHDLGRYVDWPTDNALQTNALAFDLAMARMGFEMLRDTTLYVRTGPDSIALSGLRFELTGGGWRPTVPDACFSIDLRHDPLPWPADSSKADLTLSGHTHGCQLKLPGLTPLDLLGMPASGLYADGRHRLYVTDGLGVNGLPLRLGAWPEVTLLTLHHQPAND